MASMWQHLDVLRFIVPIAPFDEANCAAYAFDDIRSGTGSFSDSSIDTLSLLKYELSLSSTDVKSGSISTTVQNDGVGNRGRKSGGSNKDWGRLSRPKTNHRKERTSRGRSRQRSSGLGGLPTNAAVLVEKLAPKTQEQAFLLIERELSLEIPPEEIKFSAVKAGEYNFRCSTPHEIELPVVMAEDEEKLPATMSDEINLPDENKQPTVTVRAMETEKSGRKRNSKLGRIWHRSVRSVKKVGLKSVRPRQNQAMEMIEPVETFEMEEQQQQQQQHGIKQQ